MKKFFLILSVFITINTFSQINKIIDFDSDTYGAALTKIGNNYYVETGYRSGYRGLKLLKLDKNFDTLIVKTIWADTMYISVNQNPINKSGNRLILANELYTTSCDSAFIAFSVLDTNLDTVLSTVPYQSELKILVRNVIPTKDSGFAICGTEGSIDVHYDAFLLKLDSLGNKEWIKFYGYTYNEQFVSMLQADNGDFVLAGSSEKYHMSYDDWYIVRTDSAGNQIWDWIVRNPDHDVANIDNYNDYYIEDLIQTKDGNFIAVGGKSYSSEDYVAQDSRLLKFDINKNVILDKLYSEYTENTIQVKNDRNSKFSRIKEKDNGHFVLINMIQNMPCDHRGRTPLIYELDENFKLITKRRFESRSYGLNDNYFRDFIIEDDGGLSLVGDAHVSDWGDDNEPPYNRLWLVKTDKDYCDGFGSCDTNLAVHFFPPDTILKTDTVDLQFEIISDWDIDYNIEFTYYDKNLYDITSEMVYNVSTDNVYPLRMSYKWLKSQVREYSSAVVEDTVYIMAWIVPSDSSSKAIFPTKIRDNYIVFVDDHTAISTIEQAQDFTIQPNPAQDYVFIKKNNTAPESVFLMDVSGKTLSEYTMSNQSLKIDVSQLKNGMYFIKKSGKIKKLIIMK